MAFNDLEKQLIKNIVGGICDKKTPAHLRTQLRFEHRIKNHDVILLEIRPHWRLPEEITELPFAKLKYVRTTNKWKLYWMRANGKWHRYENEGNKYTLKALAEEIEIDRWGCFFG